MHLTEKLVCLDLLYFENVGQIAVMEKVLFFIKYEKSGRRA